MTGITTTGSTISQTQLTSTNSTQQTDAPKNSKSLLSKIGKALNPAPRLTQLVSGMKKSLANCKCSINHVDTSAHANQPTRISDPAKALA